MYEPTLSPVSRSRLISNLPLTFSTIFNACSSMSTLVGPSAFLVHCFDNSSRSFTKSILIKDSSQGSNYRTFPPPRIKVNLIFKILSKMRHVSATYTSLYHIPLSC